MRVIVVDVALSKYEEQDITAYNEEKHNHRPRQVAMLTYAFRPMFLAAGMWVIVAIAMRLAILFGYFKLPTRFGLSVLDAGVPVSAAIHALTAGAIETMILAVMPRVTLGHTGRDLTATS